MTYDTSTSQLLDRPTARDRAREPGVGNFPASVIMEELLDLAPRAGVSKVEVMRRLVARSKQRGTCVGVVRGTELTKGR